MNNQSPRYPGPGRAGRAGNNQIITNIQYPITKLKIEIISRNSGIHLFGN